MDSGWAKEACIGAQIPHMNGQLLGERTCLSMLDNTAMSCANMAEPINLPFGLWTWVGLKETPVQLYSPGGANVPTLAPRGIYVLPSAVVMWLYVKFL